MLTAPTFHPLSSKLPTATYIALLPLAIGIGEGAEAQAPLARAVVGGLLASRGGLRHHVSIERPYSLAREPVEAHGHASVPRVEPASEARAWDALRAAGADPAALFDGAGRLCACVRQTWIGRMDDPGA